MSRRVIVTGATGFIGRHYAYTRAKAAKFVADESNDSMPLVVNRKWHTLRQKAIQALTELLKDPDAEVRKAAREGLSQLR